MTINELIKELQQYDENKKVVIPHCDLQEGKTYDVITSSEDKDKVILWGK